MSALTGFGAAILAVEAERIEQAKEAVTAGWTAEDHPARCCPPDEPVPPAVRTREQKRKWARSRAVNAEARARANRRVAKQLQAMTDAERRADFGEANIPFAKRAKATEAAITRARQIERALHNAKHHASRAEHWREVERNA